MFVPSDCHKNGFVNMIYHMKFLVLLGTCCVALVFTACGDDNSTQSDSSLDILVGREGRPDVPVPQGPPPTKLALEDLEKGSGIPAEKGDEISVRYFNFDYKSHRVYEDRWNDVQPFSFVLGSDEVLDAWETGLKGMKAGGRRELIVPKAISYGNVDQIYVIELLSITSPKPAVKREPSAVRRVAGTGAKPRIQIPPGPPPKRLVVRELRAMRSAVLLGYPRMESIS